LFVNGKELARIEGENRLYKTERGLEEKMD
jgi:hypothetical protein